MPVQPPMQPGVALRSQNITFNMSTIKRFFRAGFLLAIALALFAPRAHGQIYLSNVGAGVVEKFPLQGGAPILVGSGLTTPEGVALDSAGNLYVGTANGRNILKYVGGGGTPSVFVPSTYGLAVIYGLAFDSAGSLYVVSSDNTIWKFAPNGTGSVFTGVANTSNNGLNNPFGIATDAAGNVYVGNRGDKSVWKFSASGVGSVLVPASFGLGSPNGLAFKAGNLYVADNNQGKIQRFDSTSGNFLSTFADTTSGLNGPVGIAFDTTGNLYVANGDNSVRKYDSNGTGSTVGTTSYPFPTFIAIKSAATPACAPGETWTPQASGSRFWRSIASSAAGSNLVAVADGDFIYTSTDAGLTWTPHESARTWTSVASSSAGSNLIAVANGSEIYISADAGSTWTPRETVRNWYCVASSADGTNLVAAAGNDKIYTSADAGLTWTGHDSPRNWYSVASSADGTHLVAVAISDQIYTSANAGLTWTARDSARNWRSVASSANGNNLVAVAYGGLIYTSANAGLSWTPRETARNWNSVASSSDGSRLVAAAISGKLYTSADFGVNWTPRENVRTWYCVASSASGGNLAAADFEGRIYTSACATTSLLTCAADKSVDCGVAWTFDPPVVAGSCAAGNTTLTILSTVTNALDPRLITRTWQATNPCGESATCSQTVTLTGSTPPSIACPANINITTCSSNAVVTFAPPVVTGGTLASISQASGSSFNVGTNVVICTATNACGTNTCSFNIVVTQTPAVSITCPANIAVNTCSNSAVVTFAPPVVTGGTLASISQASGSSFNVGTNTVVCTATNACGTNTCSFNIVVKATPPSLICSTNKTVLCGTAWDFDAPTVLNCDGSTNTSATLSISTVTNGVCPVVITRTWYYGATAASPGLTCSQTVTVSPAAQCLACETWTPRDSNRNWTAVASSADGTKLVATEFGGLVYTSGDSGVSWSPQIGSGIKNWWSIASSADGTRLAAIASGGPIQTSSDSGVTWTAQASGIIAWQQIASSADGSKLVATADNNFIYTSTDYGVTWTQRAIGGTHWRGVASSADGTKLAAVVSGGSIYTSTDSGVTWNMRASGSGPWYSIASSADGTKLVAGQYGGQLFTSNDSGLTWTMQTTFVQSWLTVASSANGTKLVAAAYNNNIYCSTDSGVTWTPHDTGRTWNGLAVSSDGSKLVAVVYGGGKIYTAACQNPPLVICATNKTAACGVPWNFDPPVILDGCSGTNATITTISTSTNGTNPTQITRVWLVTDACTNSVICSQTVELAAASLPVITCPPTIAVNTCTNGAVVTFSNPVVSSGAILAIVPPSGSTFHLGTNTVVCIATNACGTNLCSFDVVVTQIPAVSIACPATINASTCGTSALVTFPSLTVTGGALESCTPPSGSSFNLGTNTVLCIATNACGKTQCSFKVVVTQIPAPIISCPPTISAFTCSNSAVVNFSAPLVTGGTLASVFPPSGSAFNVGTNTVTCTATNACGSTFCSFKVIVTQVPQVTITCPANLTVTTCSNAAIVTFTNPIVTGGGLLGCVPASGSSFNVGTNTVVCMATNACGTNICTFSVIVTKIPTVAVVCPITVFATTCSNSAVVILPPPFVTNGVFVSYNPPSGSSFNVGTNNVLCTVSNACDFKECVFKVVVTKGQAMTLNCPPTITTNICGTSTIVSFPDPVVSGGTLVGCVPPSGSFFNLGTNTVVCTATNACGATICSFNIVVLNTNKPTIICSQNIVVTSCTVTQVTYQAAAFSACCKTAPVVTCNPPSGHPFQPGTTTPVTCTAIDCAGNVAVCSFTVTVVASNAPPSICTNATFLTFTAGNTNDNFTGVEPASPSTALRAWQQSLFFSSGKGFDDCTLAKVFGHTFTNLPACIVGATIELRLKACGQGSVNDFLALNFNGQNGGAPAPFWSRSLGNANGSGYPGLFAPTVWSAGTTRTVTLDLASLTNVNGTTTSLLSALNLYGYLDLTLADDSAIDYATLTVKVCCGPKNITVTAPTNACCVSVNYPAPQFNSGCSTVTTVCNPPSGFCFPIGTTVVECIATDSLGQVGRSYFKVTVNGGAPTIITACPTNIVACAGTNLNVGVMPDVLSQFRATNACTPAGQLVYTQDPPAGTLITNSGIATFTVSNGNGSPVTCTAPILVQLCCVPLPPLTGMTLWLTFDESVGNFAFNSINANGGTLMNGINHALGQFVNNSLRFDGVNNYVTVPSYPALNPGTGSFTIDAWIRREPGSGMGIRVIVDKRQPSNNGNGYILAVGAPGTLVLQMNTFNFLDTVAIPADNLWHFVAITVQRGGFTSGQFYVDGVPTTAFSTTAAIGNISNTTAFRVGSSQITGPLNWLGGIDEVEQFNRALTPAEIKALYNARTSGKCRPTATLPLLQSVCGSPASQVVNTTLKNNSPIAQTYTYYSLPGAAGTGALFPTSFSPNPGTVTVAPHATVTIPVTVNLPTLSCGSVVSYQIVFVEASSGDIFSCQGSLRRICSPLCFHIINHATELSHLGLGRVPFIISNTTGVRVDAVGMRVRVVGPDGMPDMTYVSLNGLAPGMAYEVPPTSIDANGEITLSIGVQFVDYSPGAPFTLVLESDIDGDGMMDTLVTAEVVNDITPMDISLEVTTEATGPVLNWSAQAWTLQSASSINGPWTDMPGATSPFTINPAGPAKFYRLNQMKSPLAP